MSDQMSVRELAEWDWLVRPGDNRLHAPKQWDVDEQIDDTQGEGVAECGATGLFVIPGLFTRAGARRCARCCDRTGFPRGVGSPKNDDDCRPLAKARIEALGVEK